jgi:hypothetical protein
MATEEQVTQPQEAEQQERPTLMSPTTRNLIMGTAIVVILLTLTAWSGAIRTENAKRDGLRADVAALAMAFKYPLLEANSLRTSAGRERLAPILAEVARAGGYHALTLTDAEGKVLATTEGTLIESVPEGDLPKSPRVGRVEAGLSASAPVMLGGAPIGYLFVETDR